MSACTLFLIETDGAVSEAFQALSGAYGVALVCFASLEAAIGAARPGAQDVLIADLATAADLGRLDAWIAGMDDAPRLVLLAGRPLKNCESVLARHAGACVLQKPVDPAELLVRLGLGRAPERPAPRT